MTLGEMDTTEVIYFFNSLKDVVILDVLKLFVRCGAHTGRLLLWFRGEVFSSETAWARLAGVAK